MPKEKSHARFMPKARQDVRSILLWSEKHFGLAAATRYRQLILQAVSDVVSDPHRPGVSQRIELPPNVYLYHLGLSRDAVTGEIVKEPRHFLVFRIKASRLEILRILHDSSDLPRHL